MSLIDPQTRLLHRDTTRRAAAYACWTIAITLAGLGMWSFLADTASTLPVWFNVAAAVLPIPLLVAGAFLMVFGTDTDDIDPRLHTWPLAFYFVASGTGALIGAHMSPQGIGGGHVVFVLFVLGGVIAVVVTEWLRRRARRDDVVRDRVERSGILASGVVTRARTYSVNYQAVTRVTVKFTDNHGRSRWASATVGGHVSTGQAMRVRYSPGDLDRKAGVIVNPPRLPR